MPLVYAVFNTVNNKYYIGQTIRTAEQRWRTHVNEALRGSNKYLHTAIRKHGIEAFRVFVIAEVDTDRLNQVERDFVALFQSNQKEYGYNRTSGGGDRFSKTPEEKESIRARMIGNKHSLGVKLTEDHKEKLRMAKGKDWATGKIFTSEHRRRMSESAKQRADLVESGRRLGLANKGKSQSPETKELRSKRRIGRKHSPETIAKMSAARKLWHQRKACVSYTIIN